MCHAFQHVKLAFTNCFLLRCEGGYLLIDTSFPGKYKLSAKELNKIGIDVVEIKCLLLTLHLLSNQDA